MRLIKLLFCIFLISIYAASAFDLGNLEDTFVEDGEVNAFVVVGDAGTSSDVIAQSTIITYLGRYTDGPPKGIAKLTSEIDDIYERNMISVGNPCVNEVTEEIMDYDGDCNFDEGLMKFYEKNGKVQLILYGASEKSIREAAISITKGDYSGEEQVIELTTEEKLELERQRELEELLKRTQEAREQEEDDEPDVEIEHYQETEDEEVEDNQEPVIEEKPKSFFAKIIDFFRRLFGMK